LPAHCPFDHVRACDAPVMAHHCSRNARALHIRLPG
jgi:hypothetical protein